MPKSTKIVEITPAQCRAARAHLDYNQGELASKASLGLSTVVDFERARRAVSAEAVDAIRAALEAAGVEFTNGDQPGVRLRKARDAPDRD
jgi:hypothetical protein